MNAAKPESPLNALTVDVEDYFQVSAFRASVSQDDWESFPSRVEQNTERVLLLFDELGVKATFFVLGWVAEHFPRLVRRIIDAGHEVGCHSYAHRLVYEMTPAEFRADTLRAMQVIEQASGMRVSLYRAPSFSITPRSKWALEILQELGFTHDSSLFPIHHDLYGYPGIPRTVFSLPLANGELWEFPPSTIDLGPLTLPITGGGYLRILPLSYQILGLRYTQFRGIPAMLYLHPWELDPGQPRISASLRSKVRHYTGLRTTERKLRTLLSIFKFGPMTKAASVATGAPVPLRSELSEPVKTVPEGGGRLRVLVIDEEVPLPADSGKRIRTWSLLKTLAQRHEVTLLTYSDSTHDDELRSAFIQPEAVSPAPVLSMPTLYFRIFCNLFSRLPFSVEKHYSRRFADRLHDLLSVRKFDLVHCEWTPYAQYLQGISQPTVIATHNVEAQIWSRRAQVARSLFAKAFFWTQALKMRSFERRVLASASAVTSVSELDSELMRAVTGMDVTTVSNGVDVDFMEPSDIAEEGILFLGSLDWQPNQDAVLYFVESILPLIRTSLPHTKITVVGRKPPVGFRRSLENRVQLFCDVPDVRPTMAAAAVVVVPLRIGGGTRIKILEALSMRKAVVSTRVGAEGLDVIDGQHLLLADEPDEFADSVCRLLQNPELRDEMGRNGRRLVENRYAWSAAADTLEKVWRRAAGAQSLQTTTKQACGQARVASGENGTR